MKTVKYLCAFIIGFCIPQIIIGPYRENLHQIGIFTAIAIFTLMARIIIQEQE